MKAVAWFMAQGQSDYHRFGKTRKCRLIEGLPESLRKAYLWGFDCASWGERRALK